MTEEDVRRIVREEIEAWAKQPRPSPSLPPGLFKRTRQEIDAIPGIEDARKSIMRRSPVPEVDLGPERTPDQGKGE